MGNLCLSNETINVRLKRINLVKDVAQTKENIIGTTRTSISQQKKTIKQKSMILDSKPSSNRIESRYNRKIFEFINPNRFNLNRSSELLRTLMRLQSISDITDCFKLNYKIFKDQKRIKTYTQKDIVQQISLQPFTREKIEEIKQNPNRLPADTALILMPPFSEFDRIVPGVYQTSVTGIVSETMRANRIRLIINATYEMPLLKNPEFISIRVPIEDDPQEMILEYFDDVADLLEFVRLKGYCSVVHCMAGVSRSAALILAYLIKYTTFNLFEAFLHIKSIREPIRPNIGFLQQLNQYEMICKGQSSVEFETIEIENDRIKVLVPKFYRLHYPELYDVEIQRQIHYAKTKQSNQNSPS